MKFPVNYVCCGPRFAKIGFHCINKATPNAYCGAVEMRLLLVVAEGRVTLTGR